MARAGQRKDREAAPERKCVATGAVLSKADLVRFVIGPDDSVAPDILNRLPGRGIYVVPEASALAKAAKRGLFARAARRPVTVPEGLPALVEEGLARRVITLMSLARKAGEAVAGFEKVKAWIDRGEAAVLIQARDGSERGKSKLRPPNGPDSFIGALTAQELGLAFGREHVIHAALKAGGLTERIVEEARRLKGLRPNDGGTGHLKG